jgi:hypothetical protein
MTLEAIEKYLKELSSQQDLIRYATTCCEQYLDACLREDTSGSNASLGGYSREELILAFDRQELVFEHYLQQSPLIHTRIGLYIRDPQGMWVRSLEPVGFYILETNEAGEAVDDWISITQEKKADAAIDMAYHLQALNALLPKDGLSKDSIYYEYITQVHHAVSLFQSKQYAETAASILNAFAYREKQPQKVIGIPYFKSSKRLLKMLANQMHEKVLLPAETVRLLEVCGVIKPNP